MAVRKHLPVSKKPDFTGLGRDDKDPKEWMINKSKPLTTLSQTSMTLPEFKIFDAYLSRIDSHKPDERYVRFEKGELEKLLGVEKINKSDLNKRLRNLFQTLEIHDERKPKGFTLIALFTKAECEQDEEGLWQVNLACSSAAMEYIFNPESLTYLKYRLKNVINLTSRYSYILFLYLMDCRWRKVWTISLDELKQMLNCTAERYAEEFKYFNAEVLKKCQKEINEKTDISFSYEPVKKGRKVAAVQFTVKTLADQLPDDEKDPDQLSLLDDITPDFSAQLHESADIETEWCDKYGIDCDDGIVLMASACNFEFTSVQIREIMEFVRLMSLKSPYGTEIAQHHYLAQTYARLNTAAERANKTKGSIKHRYNYFLTLVKKDLAKK